MLTKADDPSHKQKAIYSLTERSIQLIPIMAALGTWGTRWLDVSDELSIRARLLTDGGEELWDRFMEELRSEHLGKKIAPAPDGKSVRQRLQEAYLDVVAGQQAS
jgi:hypothetical protein